MILRLGIFTHQVDDEAVAEYWRRRDAETPPVAGEPDWFSDPKFRERLERAREGR